MADEEARCPECGSPLPEGGPAGGLCPRCLMKQAMISRGATRTADGGRFEPPDPADLAGRFPHLEILELIGHGGMGAVYKARQPKLDRLVALKILDPNRVRDPAFAERFGREARTLARLSHPHVVAIHDFGETDGLYYFVMEHVDGASLREVMQAGRLSPREALALVPQICEALQFAHESGVVHRDIKPENILLDRSGRVKIADFGLAKLLEPDRGEGVSLTVTGEVMGTPAYMAPEQIEHPLDVDHRADIYAVGVVFYEMLTGELPLGRFDPPSSKVRMDVRLDRVVLRALEKEPTRRYQLAGDVKADLDRLDASGDVQGSAPASAPAGGDAPATRTVEITRPPVVTWIATYSFLLSGVLALLGIVVFPLLLLEAGRTTLGLGWSSGGFRASMGADPYGRLWGPLFIATGGGLLLLLSLWHLIAGLGALRLRNWARYHLIVLVVLELAGSLLVVLASGPIGFLAVTVASAAVLVYLFMPSVARLFELGLGPAALTPGEADAVEHVLRRRTLGRDRRRR